MQKSNQSPDHRLQNCLFYKEQIYEEKLNNDVNTFHVERIIHLFTIYLFIFQLDRSLQISIHPTINVSLRNPLK